jgi:hypothetical protein
MRSRPSFVLFILFGLFALFSAGLIAQDLAQSSQANPATPSAAPSPLPVGLEPAAPLALTTNWCSQYNHGSCYYTPEPLAPDQCCRGSFGCPSLCILPPEE